jgi:murein DD-endopeptidase MepM/ murein hydrolase activator NlpD
VETRDSGQNISGLSFRDLADDSYESNTSKEDFIFLDTEIYSDAELNLMKKAKRFLVRYFNSSRGFLSFIVDFSEYILSRFRIIWIIMSVVVDIVYKQFDTVKDSIVRKMFWGRGSFLKYVVQIASIVIAFILAISYVYRAPTITSANSEDLEYILAAESDTVVMNATINTLTNKDNKRRVSEKYIVMNGDTLSSIANYYDISIETIKWANNMTSDLVKPGQELDIPPGTGVLIKVAKNETLESISKKYNGNDQAIADFNWLDYPFTLIEGQELFIPEGRMPAAPAPKPVYASAPRTYTSGSSGGSVTGTADPNVGRFLGWPVAGGSARISQYYKGSIHRGIDIADRNLPNILAASGGTVIFAGCAGYCPPLGSTWGGSGYAWSIHIDHGNGYSTWYAHLKNIYVRSGQGVSKGQAIGQMGSTGRSTGPHLHFELRKGSSSQINPLPYTSW